MPEGWPAGPDGGVPGGGVPGGSPTALPLEVAAALLGGYRWIEHRLFELTGAWALDEVVPAAQLLLDEASLQHAWHAELWADRLPVLDWVDPEALTAPPGPVAGPLLAALAEAGSATGPVSGPPTSEAAGRDLSVRRLTGLYRVVLPRLLATYRGHLCRVVPVTDGPARRALRLVLRDEVDSLLAGEALLQGLLSNAGTAEAAAALQRRLESVVVDGGPGPGLVPWPAP